MPRPDVLVLPDAPDRIIHARKPERPAEEQTAQQERFRDLVRRHRRAPRRSPWTRRGCPSGTIDPVAPVVTAVVAALHRKH